MTDLPPYDPADAVKVLHRHQVRFLIIGGIAGNLHGSGLSTYDLDICYDRARPNLEALAGALRELGATLRGAPPDLPFRLDAQTLLNGDSFTFDTRAGPLDCLGTPAGTGGYPDLVRGAVAYEVDDIKVLVTSLDDLIRMKRASGRPKDRVELEILGALREELDDDTNPAVG